MSFTFSRKKKLKRNVEYQCVYKTPDIRFREGNILLLAKKNNYTCPRLGISISKKHVKHAVDRNLFKRIVRESFRQKNNLLAYDVIIVGLKNIKHVTHYELMNALTSLWKKLADTSVQ